MKQGRELQRRGLINWFRWVNIFENLVPYDWKGPEQEVVTFLQKFGYWLSARVWVIADKVGVGDRIRWVLRLLRQARRVIAKGTEPSQEPCKSGKEFDNTLSVA